MDKSNHRITVDREYLEELEKFYEQYGSDNKPKENIVGRVGTHHNRQMLLLELNNITDRDLHAISIIYDDGHEAMRFVRNII